MAELIPGFSHRPQQQAMAERVAGMIAGGGVLLCEAGTGTGKTFAYLVPAILAGRKVILSTGTRHLQDQLFRHDLPLIRQALRVQLRAVLLKGRANYLCRHRLQGMLGDPLPQDPEQRAWLSQICDWAQVTQSGDIAELPIPEEAPIWSDLTSTTETCLGQKCPNWSDCHLVAARRAAQAADLVVINHHLFCADLALRNEGFGEILPGAEVFILDEAHQLPEIATSFFGLTLSSRQLLDLARDSEREAARAASAGANPVPAGASDLRKAVQDLRLSLGETDRRGPWDELEQDTGVQRALAGLASRIQGLAERLAVVAGYNEGLDACRGRAQELLERLERLTRPVQGDAVHWFETTGRGWRLHETPLEIAEVFGARVNQPGTAWILTSATLAVGGDFTHFMARLGIAQAQTACWESPFDYSRQGLCFIPPSLPEPAAPDYNQCLLDLVCELLDYSQGRAFLLFTSHRALRELATGLEGRIGYPLLIQGTAPRTLLLERFRRLGNAVLLGTASFWEGVDVRGQALSCVIIDRLPFASPDDPVLAARIAALRVAGQDPFWDYQLPQAVLALKQGAGRLIRGPEDRGVLVICDSRLLSRRYGRVFLESLPPMNRTQRIADVKRFFAHSPVMAGEQRLNGRLLRGD